MTTGGTCAVGVGAPWRAVDCRLCLLADGGISTARPETAAATNPATQSRRDRIHDQGFLISPAFVRTLSPCWEAKCSRSGACHKGRMMRTRQVSGRHSLRGRRRSVGWGLRCCLLGFGFGLRGCRCRRWGSLRSFVVPQRLGYSSLARCRVDDRRCSRRQRCRSDGRGRRRLHLSGRWCSHCCRRGCGCWSGLLTGARGESQGRTAAESEPQHSCH